MNCDNTVDTRIVIFVEYAYRWPSSLNFFLSLTRATCVDSQQKHSEKNKNLHYKWFMDIAGLRLLIDANWFFREIQIMTVDELAQ